MHNPSDRVRKSIANSDEIADEPDDITTVTSIDEDGNIVGILVAWDSAEWILADGDSFQRLDETQ